MNTNNELNAELVNELASGSADDYVDIIASDLEHVEIDAEQNYVSEFDLDQECANILNAATKGSVNQLRLFLRNVDTAINCNSDERGNTALHLATENGHLEAAMFLMENGANFNGENKEGDIPLHLAAKIGCAKLVDALLDKNAPVDFKNAAGNAPIHLACRSGSFEVTELLVKKKANVNLKNEEGNTPLYYAVESGSENIVKYLLESGAAINVENKSNDIVLFWANNNDVINLLIKKGANSKHINKFGNTALHQAAESNKPILAQNLLNRGFQVDTRNKHNGKTALIIAAKRGSHTVIEMLLRNGAHINEVDYDRWTALHWAAFNGHFQAAEKLLQNGPEVDPLDFHNFTPLMRASCSGHGKIIQLLLLHGANKNLRNKNGDSALDYAEEYEHEEIVKLLK